MAVWNLVIVALTASGNAVGDFAPLFAIRPGMSITNVEALLKDDMPYPSHDTRIFRTGPWIDQSGTYLYCRDRSLPLGVVVVYGRDGRVVSSRPVQLPVDPKFFRSGIQLSVPR